MYGFRQVAYNQMHIGAGREQACDGWLAGSFVAVAQFGGDSKCPQERLYVGLDQGLLMAAFFGYEYVKHLHECALDDQGHLSQLMRDAVVGAVCCFGIMLQNISDDIGSHLEQFADGLCVCLVV